MNIFVGDTVVRWLSGVVPMELKVTAVDDRFIYCGPWKFDREFGYEVDEDLGWGQAGADGRVNTGSYIVRKEGPDADNDQAV